MQSASTQIRVALMRQNSKRRRQLIRETSHLPFYERISSRNGSTANSSEVDPNELPYKMTTRRDELGTVDKFTLNEQVIMKAKKAFERFDLNNDGVIDLREMTSALVALGYNPTDEEVKEIMNEVDQNGNDRLDFLEFLRVIQRQKDKSVKLTEKEKQEININMAWKALSESDKSSMCVEKFKKVLNSFALAIDVDALVRAMDIDESGRIDFDEFHTLFTDSTQRI